MFERIGKFEVVDALAVFDPATGLRNTDRGESGIFKAPYFGWWGIFVEKHSAWNGKLVVAEYSIDITKRNLTWTECDFGVAIDSGRLAIYNLKYVNKVVKSLKTAGERVFPYGVVVYAGVGDGYYPGVFEARDAYNRLLGIKIDFFFDYEDYGDTE